MDDADVLAGCAFWRTIASPSEAGKYSYLQIANPVGSGVNLYIDEVTLWGGDSVPSEYGVMYYDTLFSDPGLVGHVDQVSNYPLINKLYGAPQAKSSIYVCTSAEQLASRIDYYWHAAASSEVAIPQQLDPAIVLTPGNCLVFWNTVLGLEGCVSFQCREK